MRKTVGLFVVAIILGVLVGNLINRPPQRDFEFHGGIRDSGGGYVKSTSYVLINEENYDPDEMMQRVYEEFCKMNGEPDELTLYLYDSKEKMDELDYSHMQVYIKGD